MTGDAGRQREKIAAVLQGASSGPGQVRVIEYEGVAFHVSRRFVLADLSPLSFFHLVERIEDDPAEAVLQLYERLVPLLSCRHEWAELKRSEDERIAAMGNRHRGDASPKICRSCMAYALGGVLPVVGTSLV